MRLAQDDAGMGEHRPSARLTAGEQHRGIRDSLAHARRRHGSTDMRHRIVDGGHRGQRPARGVDVHVDRQLLAHGFEVEELGDDGVRDPVVDGHTQVDDPIAQQMRIDVDDLLRVPRPVDDVRDRVLAHDRTPAVTPSVRPGAIGA